MGTCKPGDYQCHPTSAAWLLVCDSNSNWQISTYCGMLGPYGCCRGTSWPGPEHSCDCRPSANGLFASNTIEEGIAPALSQDNKRSEVISDDDQLDSDVDQLSSPNEELCTPGTYRCKQPFSQGWLQVCDSNRVWILASQCCGPYTCVDEPGDTPATCVCGHQARSVDAPSLASSDKAVDVQQAEQASGGCKPGTYSCLAPDTAPLMVCNLLGDWMVSDVCCGMKTCRQGSTPGTAYCTCDPFRSTSQNPPLAVQTEGLTLVTVAKEAASSTAKA
jgi:hypothetical protein